MVGWGSYGGLRELGDPRSTVLFEELVSHDHHQKHGHQRSAENPFLNEDPSCRDRTCCDSQGPRNKGFCRAPGLPPEKMVGSNMV